MPFKDNRGASLQRNVGVGKLVVENDSVPIHLKLLIGHLKQESEIYCLFQGLFFLGSFVFLTPVPSLHLPRNRVYPFQTNSH